MSYTAQQMKQMIREKIRQKSYYGTGSLSYQEVADTLEAFIDVIVAAKSAANEGLIIGAVTEGEPVQIPSGVKRLYIDPATPITHDLHVILPEGAQDGDEAWILFGGIIKPIDGDEQQTVLGGYLYVDTVSGQSMYKPFATEMYGNNYVCGNLIKFSFRLSTLTWMQV